MAISLKVFHEHIFSLIFNAYGRNPFNKVGNSNVEIDYTISSFSFYVQKLEYSKSSTSGANRCYSDNFLTPHKRRPRSLTEIQYSNWNYWRQKTDRQEQKKYLCGHHSPSVSTFFENSHYFIGVKDSFNLKLLSIPHKWVFFSLSIKYTYCSHAI